MKRFWKHASAQPTSEPTGGGWGVALDARPLKTPQGRTLCVPTQSLAAAIAREWDGQGEQVQPTLLPLTRIAATALDRMVTERAAIIDELARFAESDLICYFAAEPAELVAAQQAGWAPWRAWAATRHGLALQATTGMMPLTQPPGTVERASAILDAFDPFRLAVAACLVPPLGSLILALAVLDGELAAENAFALSQIDELHQEARWGIDAEAADRRRLLAQDVAETGRFLGLLGR